ncbi:MAG: glycosyltransferase family 2 protein [Syntrophothermus sp.]
MSTVSVIIPTKNRSAMLRRAVKSVLRQTYSDWDIIIVDDASDDDTPGMVNYMLGRYGLQGRLKYIRHEKPLGGAAARNKGIFSARGFYIAFLDDDDKWMPEKLEKQVGCMKANENAGICYTGRKIVRTGDIIPGLGKKYSYRKPPAFDHYKAIMTDNFVGITSSVMIPRSVLLAVSGFDEVLPCYQDYDLFIRILERWKAVGIDEPLVLYYLEKSTQHVSLSRSKIEFANSYLLGKYSESHYIKLLKRSLFMIHLKKMLKSFSYAGEVAVWKIKKGR